MLKEIALMSASANGSYTITQQNNILLIDAQGAFNEGISEQFHQDIKAIADKMSNAPWASLVSFKENSLFTSEAEQKLIETTQYRVDNGMIAIAAVINSTYADVLQMQLQRVYQSCYVQFNFFSDAKHAKNWLDSLIK